MFEIGVSCILDKGVGAPTPLIAFKLLQKFTYYYLRHFFPNIFDMSMDLSSIRYISSFLEVIQLQGHLHTVFKFVFF